MYTRLFSVLYVILCINAQRVIELTRGNFDETIRNFDLVLVSFNAPWCGHCMALTEILPRVARNVFEKSEEMSNNFGTKFKIAICTMDGSDPSNADIIEHEQVNGFPTLLVYKSGQRIAEYEGERDEKAIYEYLVRKAGPIAYEITSIDQLVPNIAQLQHGELLGTGLLSIVLGIFVEGDTLLLEEMFRNVALHYEPSLFYYTRETSVAEHFQLVGNGIIVYSGEEQDIYHNIPSEALKSTETILSFIMKLSLPLSLPYNTDSLPLLQSLPIFSHALLCYDAQGSDDRFLDMMMTVLPSYKGRILGVEVSSEEYSLLHYFEIRAGDLPQLILVDRSEENYPRRYSFVDFLFQNYTDKEDQIMKDHEGLIERHHIMKRVVGDEEHMLYFNATFVHHFFTAYLDEELSPSLLSENEAVARESNQRSSTPVTNIVGNQFQNLVLGNEDQHALVYFHAPWCIHCKIAETIVADLADHYAKDPSMNVYRIDGSKNEVHHPQVVINSFPKIYFFPAHRKDVAVMYDGERSIDAIKEFITYNMHPDAHKDNVATHAANLDSIEEYETVNTDGNVVGGDV